MGTHKKKRISKHVLEAQERETQERTAATGGDAAAAAAAVTPAVAKKPLKKKKKHSVKNPMEAASYLSLWKLQQTTPKDGASVVWKFNKNTQSWLFRHMYESDKVSKTTFGTLMDYLVSVKSVPLRQRLNENAMRRAQRYKNWEKEQAATTESSSTQGESKETDTKKSSLPSSTNTPPGGDDNDELMEEQEAWTKLDAHDKRNEYKRTRKVLDTLKQNSTSEKSVASENQTDS
eukprot:scaffold74948_cov49-Attheya_sp.AAC.4